MKKLKDLWFKELEWYDNVKIWENSYREIWDYKEMYIWIWDQLIEIEWIRNINIINFK